MWPPDNSLVYGEQLEGVGESVPPWSSSPITQLLFHTFWKQSLEEVSAARKEANAPSSLSSHSDPIWVIPPTYGEFCRSDTVNRVRKRELL